MPALIVNIVRPGLRIERRLDRRHLGAKTDQHRFKHMIAADAQPVADDLHVNVSVAEMPREARQIDRGSGCHLEQRLRLVLDAHDRAIVEHEPVAVPERHGVRQIEQEFRSFPAGEHDPTPMPLVRIEHDEVDDPI